MEKELDITELIHRGGVLKNVEGFSTKDIYHNIIQMIDLPDCMDREQVYNALCAREEILSTAVGNGIALPHARAPIMKDENDQRICVAYLKQPINMNAPDERFVHVMFVLLTQNPQDHLKVLSTLAGLFRDVSFRKALESNASEAELINLIREIEKNN
mgnify:FL=1